MKEKIHCGLSSYGMSGRVFHRPLIDAHSDFQLDAVVQHTQDISDQVNSSVRIYTSYEEMLNNHDIDLIIVNIPDHLHFKYVKEALLAKKNVVVEKPLTLSYTDGYELIKLAEKVNKHLFIFQNRRWDSDFLTIQKLINSDKIGRVIEFEAHYDRYRPVPPTNTWKEDEKLGPGLLYNLGAHLIDQILVLFGRPNALFADIDTMRKNGQIVDYFNIIFFYNNHRAIVRSTYLAREPAFKYMIQGELGSFIKSGTDPQEERLAAGWQADQIGIGTEDPLYQGKLFIEQYPKGIEIDSCTGNYLKFYDGVAQELGGTKNAGVSAAEGLEVVELIEAAIKSNKTGTKIQL